jgi:hypothetical protein
MSQNILRVNEKAIMRHIVILVKEGVSEGIRFATPSPAFFNTLEQ